MELPGNLTGNYFVRAIRSAFHDARHWLPRRKHQAELRRHALKLRFWPERHPEDDNGQLLDLDWSWIRSLSGKNVGELRIHDTIGDCDNLRVIFFDPKTRKPLPMLWIIGVLQKKSDDFTTAQIRNYRLRRQLVLERFYQLE